MLLNYSDFKCYYLPVKRCSEYGTKKVIDVNILALNRVFFPNYCLIIKTSRSLKVRSIGLNGLQAKKIKSIFFLNPKAWDLESLGNQIKWVLNCFLKCHVAFKSWNLFCVDCVNNMCCRHWIYLDYDFIDLANFNKIKF